MTQWSRRYAATLLRGSAALPPKAGSINDCYFERGWSRRCMQAEGGALGPSGTSIGVPASWLGRSASFGRAAWQYMVAAATPYDSVRLFLNRRMKWRPSSVAGDLACR